MSSALLNRKRQPALAGLLIVAAGALALHPLTVTWETIENYSYGWLIPLAAIYFFLERWPARPHPERRPGFSYGGLMLGSALFFALRVVLESDPTWRVGLWAMTTLYIIIVLIVLGLEGGLAWVRHFCFPVLLIYLSVPWPAELEDALILGLMRTNAILVHDTLDVLGVKTSVAGHVIVLPNCQLGIDEACSGILSLQASLMMGCLLGEIYHLSWRRRIALALGSMMLALLGNYARTLFLSGIALDGGPDAVLRWHDTAGYSILVFTGICSWLLALLFSRTAGPVGSVASPTLPTSKTGQTESPGSSVFRLAVLVFAIALGTEITVQAWFGWREMRMESRPGWAVNFSSFDTFTPLPISPTVQSLLQYDEAQEGEWTDRNAWRWTAFWFFYHPKAGTATVLNWHNPLSCLPSIGWQQQEVYPAFSTTAHGCSLHTEAIRFSAGVQQIYVFWLIYPLNGILPAGIDRPHAPFTAKIHDRLRDVWHGYRGVGMETLEVVVQGPDNYQVAQAAYLENLNQIVESPRFNPAR